METLFLPESKPREEPNAHPIPRSHQLGTLLKISNLFTKDPHQTRTEFLHPEGKNGWLSNQYNTPINYRGETYPSGEHLYQALKAKCPRDARKIRKATAPTEAKTLAKEIGRKLPIEEKISNMQLALSLKFSQHPKLKAKIQEAQGVILLTSRDPLWGIGPEKDGTNLLGLLLMEQRARLRNFHTCKQKTTSKPSSPHPTQHIPYQEES